MTPRTRKTTPTGETPVTTPTTTMFEETDIPVQTRTTEENPFLEAVRELDEVRTKAYTYKYTLNLDNEKYETVKGRLERQLTTAGNMIVANDPKGVTVRRVITLEGNNDIIKVVFWVVDKIEKPRKNVDNITGAVTDNNATTTNEDGSQAA